MSNFLNFIQNHDKYFKKYKNINDIDKNSLVGWLYIFCASCYDQDITRIFNELIEKFGKTVNQLFVRMDQYEPEVDIKDIEAIHCTLASERERLVKAFLKERTSIKPIVGQEYFAGCRNLIKILMLIIVFISDEEIIFYEQQYDTNNKKEYYKLFDRIEGYIEEIKKDDKFELKIKEDICEKIIDEKINCNFCNKSFANLKVLKNHQNTDILCLKIQHKHNIYRCKFCNEELSSTVYLEKHLIEQCKTRRKMIDNEIKNYYNILEIENQELKIKNTELQKENYELKIQHKLDYENKDIDDIQKLKNEINNLHSKIKLYEESIKYNERKGKIYSDISKRLIDKFYLLNINN
jgi:hypothetical protein